jgi:hypothetical protein
MGMSKILGSVTPLSVTVPNGIWSDFREEMYAPNVMFSKVPEDAREDFKAYVSKRHRLFGHLRISGSLMCVYLCDPAPQANRYLRYLKGYLNEVGGDPMLERMPSGQIEFKCDDPYVSVRILLFLNAAFWIRASFMPDNDFFSEIVLYLFQDPFRNAMQLKELLNPVVRHAFASPKGGRRLEWSGLRGESDICTPKYDFCATGWTLPFSDFKMHLDKLAQTLPLTASYLSSIRNWAMDEETMGEVLSFFGITGLVGFIRGNLDKSFVSQLGLSVPYGTLPHAALLKQLTLEMMNTGMSVRGAINESRWKRETLGYLTNRSSGMTLPPLRFLLNGKRMKLSLNDKVTTFFRLGNDAFTLDLGSKGLETSPMTTGSRDQINRRSRIIFLKPLRQYVQELLVGTTLYAGMNRTEQVAVGISGQALFDDYILYLTTGSKNGFVYNSDFAQFDITQRWLNMRRPIIEGVQDSLRFGGVDSIVMGRPVSKIFEDLFTRFAQYWYTKGIYSIRNPGCGTGEFTTIVTNSLVNLAYQGGLREWVTEHFPSVNVGWLRVLGDDAIAVLEGDVTRDFVDQFRTFAVAYASACGLQVKPEAFDVQPHHAEFTKRWWYHGTSGMRLSVLSPFTAEKERSLGDMIEPMKGYYQFMSTMVSRGASEPYCSELALATWIQMMSVPVGQVTSIPFYLYYAPSVLGGVGAYPGRASVVNTDVVIGQLMPDEAIQIALNACAQIMKTDVPRQVAKQIFKSGEFQAFEEYVHDVIPGETMKRAAEANARLKTRDIRIPKYTIVSMSEEYVLWALAGNPVIQAQGHRSLKNEAVGVDLAKWSRTFPLRALVTFEPICELSPRYNFVTTVCKRESRMAQHHMVYGYGINTTHLRTTLERSLAENREGLPRYVNLDSVLSMLSPHTHDPEVMSDLLTSLGMGSAQVAKFITSLRAALVSLNISNLALMSLGDDYVSLLDTTTRALERVTELDERFSGPVRQLLLEVSFMISLLGVQPAKMRVVADTSVLVSTIPARVYADYTLAKQFLE